MFLCACVCSGDPEGDVSGLLGAAELRVSSMDEELGQQLRAPPECPHERAGCLSELRDGEEI